MLEIKVMVVVEVEEGPDAQARGVLRVHRALAGLDRPWRMRVVAAQTLKNFLGKEKHKES